MASVVAGAYTLAMLAIFTFAFMSIFGDMITYNAVVMATDVGDVFTYDAVVMALVSGLAYGLLLSHITTKASSFIRFSLILLIVAAVPVVAMPGVLQVEPLLSCWAGNLRAPLENDGRRAWHPKMARNRGKRRKRRAVTRQRPLSQPPSSQSQLTPRGIAPQRKRATVRSNTATQRRQEKNSWYL